MKGVVLVCVGAGGAGVRVFWRLCVVSVSVSVWRSQQKRKSHVEQKRKYCLILSFTVRKQQCVLFVCMCVVLCCVVWSVVCCGVGCCGVGCCGVGWCEGRGVGGVGVLESGGVQVLGVWRCGCVSVCECV